MPSLTTIVPVRSTAAAGARASARLMAAAPALAIGAAIAICGGGYWARRALSTEVERRTAADMQAVLATAVRGADAFLDGAEQMVEVVLAAPEIRAAAAELEAEARVGFKGGAPMLRAVAPYLRPGRLDGYVVADGRGVVREASAELSAPGRVLPPDVFPVGAADKLGAPHAGLPFRGGDGRVRLLVVGAVPGSGLYMGLALEQAGLSAPLLAARAGDTGETYAFDARGLMISSSRFPQHLRRAGLIGPDEEDSALRVEIRNPGGDMTQGFRPEKRRREQPLTHGAALAVTGAQGAAGANGVTVAPYRDYRGVPVVGAWTWLPARGFGVLSEVDEDEASRPMRRLEHIFQVLLGLLAVAGGVAVAGAVVAERARRRATRAEQVARRLGEYVVERRLGGGAMGEVFLARHALLRRPTALKLLRAHHSDRLSVDRFEREVQLTASLTHPNTIAIYDYGRSQEGAFYYAMEYLEGIDLERFVARFGPCPDARVVHILRQVFGSLGEAHASGLVHRDIKPANLFLCRRGGVPDLVKVLDFGLAKLVGGRGETHASAILGTPESMAPELFESADKASARSDIYAVGCVGYYLLTGRHVFEGSSLAELCNAHLSRAPVPPSQLLGRAVDGVLERLLLASLAKQPGQRPQSAREIVEHLERSAVASAWTVGDAVAFWAAHGEEIVDGRNA